MPKYIDQEALIEKISSISITIMGVRSGRNLFDEALKSYAETVLKNIKEAPTTDVVAVVRCKDCKHFLDDTAFCKLNNKKYCWYDDAIKSENHFCSYGQRKVDNGNL